MADAVISARGVGQRFLIHHQRATSLKERFLQTRRSKAEEFWALRDIDLDIHGGETVGLIGANGSGKSTLLKLLAGILEPTVGSVRVRGRVASLLGLGAGFNGELTGRENIYLNASILGLTRREINRNFDSIVEFSGLEQFIDNQVKHYSSGQYVRLGFAIAVHVDPDVLLVDEVLAVGDEAFQAKCLAKITEFQERGCTILFVTHAVDLVPRLCSRGLVLDHGRVLHDGDALEAAERLRTLLGTAPDQSGGAAGASSALRISGVRMVDPSARAAHKGEFQVGEPLAVEVDVAVGAEPPRAAVVRVAVTGPADVPSPAPAGDPAPLATVVVVSYNGVDLVAPCLEALAAQDLPEGRMQVWVVDNASTDGTQELIERDFPWVRLIANQRNDGFAGGNNVALRQVDTPYVALLNQDARPTRDWLSRLIEPFEREQAGAVPGGTPRLAATTSKIVFLPRFLALTLSTPAFLPGTLDSRELGVRIYQVTVDGRDVTDEVLWDHLAYGPEGEGDGRFRRPRPGARLPARRRGRQAGRADLGGRRGHRQGRDRGRRAAGPGGAGGRAGRRAQQRRQRRVRGRLRCRPGLPVGRPRPVRAGRGGLHLLRRVGAVPHRGAARGRRVRRRLLHVLRGHLPRLAAARARLDDPLPARLGGAAHPRGVVRGMVALLRLPRRPQPAAAPDQERPRRPGVARGAALPADHGVAGAAGGRPGAAHPAAAAAAADPAAGQGDGLVPAPAAGDAVPPLGDLPALQGRPAPPAAVDGPAVRSRGG